MGGDAILRELYKIPGPLHATHKERVMVQVLAIAKEGFFKERAEEVQDKPPGGSRLTRRQRGMA